MLKRGAENQKLRKVRGHATDEDVAAGRATQQDMEGNDKADKCADKGVEAIQGPGLVELAKWAAERHEAYKKLMLRIQKTIAGIVLAEKEEREKQKQSHKGTPRVRPGKVDQEQRYDTRRAKEHRQVPKAGTVTSRQREAQVLVLPKTVRANSSLPGWKGVGTCTPGEHCRRHNVAGVVCAF